MYKKILVCLDGSNLAEQILPYAVEQAMCFNSKLILFRVVSKPPFIPRSAGPDAERALIDNYEREVNQAKTYLERVALSLKEKGLDVECVTVQGTLDEAGKHIVDYAHDSKVDMIAIATHGRGGLKRLVFGSVADFVLRESKLPMLVTSPQEAET